MRQNEFTGRFRDSSIEELITTFNREVGIPSFIAARGRYLIAMREEFLRRDYDVSAFIDERTICLRDRVHLVGNKIAPIPA